MPSTVESLFWISLCAVLAPLVAGAIFRRKVPEVVLLLFFGVLIGPNVFALAVTGEAIDALRQLGLGMLFLLAGYEIEVEELVGRGGRWALWTWLACLALALGAVGALGLVEAVHSEVAVAIALTTTALGALLPILKDSGLLPTRFGGTLMHHSAYGELGPIVAMALLLGARGPLRSALVMAGFVLLVLAVHRFSHQLAKEGSRVLHLVRLGAETSGQTQVRLVMFLLVTLGATAAAFDLDSVLGAFAAGVVLRRLLPAGNEGLEVKLTGLAFGFLIPIFFVTSGMAIDPEAVVEEPQVLLLFVAMILVIRGGSVFVATKRMREDGRAVFDTRSSAAMALFASTGLPIIVAVTSVAVSAGHMTQTNASVLVAGGALTVLVCPLLAQHMLGRNRPLRTRPAAGSEA
jgi:Kef-type K+ transport system membrane component KefB